MVKISPSNAGGMASIPGWGAKILHDLWPKQQNLIKKKRSNIVTNSIKTLKIVHIKEILKKKKNGGVGWAKVFFFPQTCS